MRLVRFADLSPMRWKNGGGETTELAVHPPGAALEAFDWRVSMARVAVDGPFSAFPEVDRTLVVLAGAGFDLATGFAPPVRLTEASPPHRFPADVVSVAQLVRGAVEDLNVMTRRGRFHHRVAALALDAPLELAAAAGETLILVCREGRIAAGGAVLGRRDALLLRDGMRTQVEPLEGAARAIRVAIAPA